MPREPIERRVHSGVYHLQEIFEDLGNGNCTTAGPIKIGYSNDIYEWVAQLQTGNHRLLVIIGIVPGADRDDEAFTHETLASERIRGEWFRDSPKTRERMRLDIEDAKTHPEFYGDREPSTRSA